MPAALQYDRPKWARAPRPYHPLYGWMFNCADLLIGNCPCCGRRALRICPPGVSGRCVFGGCEFEGLLPDRSIKQAIRLAEAELADPPWLRDDPDDDDAPRAEFVFLEHQTAKAWLVENQDFARFWAPKSCSIMEPCRTMPGMFGLTMPNWLWRAKLHEQKSRSRHPLG